MNKMRALVYDGSRLSNAFIAAIWVALHLYAGRPLAGVAAEAGVPPLVAWLLPIVFAMVAILPFRLQRKTEISWRTLAQWSGYASMSFMAVLLALVFLTDIFRSVLWAISHMQLSLGSSILFRPDIALLHLSVVATGASLTLIGGVQARRPRIRRVRIAIPSLPEELDGYRIVQLSDVHVGPTIQRGFVGSLVDRVNRLHPDAIAITGDLVDAYLDEVGEEVEPLRRLRSRDGVFYVTGNHEYYWRFSEWSDRLAALGLRLLKNEHHVVVKGDAKLTFAGVTDPVGRYTHKQDLGKALAGVPSDSTTILLSHRPQTAAAAEKAGVALQLSGHTHGGQFFPFSLFIRFFQPIVAGLHPVGRMWLYVSRGTGYWGPPSRLGVGAEITLLTLRRK